jgi:hypothetical protein
MLTMGEAARFKGVTPPQVLRWLKAGRLPEARLVEDPSSGTGKVWRIPLSALREFRPPGRGRPPKAKTLSQNNRTPRGAARRPSKRGA